MAIGKTMEGTMASDATLSNYPHLYPPKGFIQFDRNDLLSPVPIGGQVLLERILLTQGYEGWVRLFGIEASDWAALSWTIKEGGAPMRDYLSKSVPLGSPTTPKEVFIHITPNIPIELFVTAGGPASVRWCMWGWYYAI